MGKRFSAIDDMYGVGSSEEPSRRRRRLWPYALLAVALFVIAGSVRPVLRLRSDPPETVVGAKLTSVKGQYQTQNGRRKSVGNTLMGPRFFEPPGRLV